MESSSTSSNQGRLNQDIENFQEEQQAAEEEGRSVVVSSSCFFVAQLHILLFFLSVFVLAELILILKSV